jgi:predicted CXXCH cytochrome family protein
MKRTLAAALLLAGQAFAAERMTVVGSKHDLSVTGPGPIKAVHQANPCMFCHTLHRGGKGMSSRPDSTATYRTFESGTMKAKAAVPSGPSRICLSCHDGTIAVGQTRKGLIEMRGTPDGKIPPGRGSNLGTDLRTSHPFSIEPDRGVATRRPRGRGHVKLDGAGLVQCTSCHDPHSEFGGSTEGMFLVEPTLRSQICQSCHSLNGATTHLRSTKAYSPAPGSTAPYATVADAGCMACHRTHGAASKGQLLRMKDADADQAVCVGCHTTGQSGADVAREAMKLSSHAVTTGAHDAAEGPTNAAKRLPEATVGAARHATCVDCHNPHEATDRPPMGARIAGSLDGVWGIDEYGRRVEVSQFEYEICFKCHADSANQPSSWGATRVRRGGADQNLRRVFGATAASSHPVLGPARAADSPSLKAPLGITSVIRCSDCHASDDGPGAGGTGPRGPHGSMFRPLLERNYATSDFTAETPGNYALCYKCHDRDILLSASSAFRLHRRHVVDQLAPCSACHSAHGVSAQGGTMLNNAHLVDFDLSIVHAAPGRPYTSTGPRTGSCNLTCHGKKHDGLSY